MTNCVFYAMIFVLFLNFTIGSIKYSEVNRTFMSIYKGIFEASVRTVNEAGEPIVPYYDEEVLKAYIVDYFEKNLNKYVTDYQVSYYFIDQENNEICVSNKCRTVNVSLTAKINMFYTYDNSQSFSIYERGEIWMIN